MSGIEKYSIVVFVVTQIQKKWKVRLHLNLVAVHVCIDDFWKGPFELLTNA